MLVASFSNLSSYLSQANFSHRLIGTNALLKKSMFIFIAAVGSSANDVLLAGLAY